MCGCVYQVEIVNDFFDNNDVACEVEPFCVTWQPLSSVPCAKVEHFLAPNGIPALVSGLHCSSSECMGGVDGGGEMAECWCNLGSSEQGLASTMPIA